MSSSNNHQFFESPCRISQSLSNDRCQTILYKAVFEHFKKIKDVAALLLTSKSFQNSSFGANFIVNFAVDDVSVCLFTSVLSPSSCFSLQFAPSLKIISVQYQLSQPDLDGISKFVEELVKTKYLPVSLRALTLQWIPTGMPPELWNCEHDALWSFFRSSTTGNSWPQLRELSLEYCGVDDDVLDIICKNARQLRTVNFAGNSDITDAGIERISELSDITHLDLSHCDKITHASLEHISKLSDINYLNLAGCILVADSGLEHLSTLANITSLNLFNCDRITDAGLEHISRLSGITSLDLTCCDKITDVGVLPFLSKLSRMTSLNLSDCSGITDVGLEGVANLSNITSLSLCSCDGVTDAGLEHIAKLSGITSLTLIGCGNITDAGVKHLSKLLNISNLELFGCKITREAKTKFAAALPLCRIRD